jgi:hypothetical protein
MIVTKLFLNNQFTTVSEQLHKDCDSSKITAVKTDTHCFVYKCVSLEPILHQQNPLYARAFVYMQGNS